MCTFLKIKNVCKKIFLCTMTQVAHLNHGLSVFSGNSTTALHRTCRGSMTQVARPCWELYYCNALSNFGICHIEFSLFILLINMMIKMDIFVRNFAGSVLYKCQREDLEGLSYTLWMRSKLKHSQKKKKSSSQSLAVILS